MKREMRLSVWALMCVMVLAGCDEWESYDYEKSANRNANNTVVCNYATRLEFPKLSSKGTNRIIVNKTNDRFDAEGVNYCVEWDTDLKAQRWSCYQMHGGFSATGVSRYDKGYLHDPQLLPGEYLDNDYFYGSGFDHGHICPSADRLYSATANKQTFYLTNMQPQYNKFNAKLWAKLEAQIRSWCQAAGVKNLYVCKGATIDNPAYVLKHITNADKGKDGLLVPKYFFCALLLENATGYKAIAFWMMNENIDRSNDGLGKYAMSVDELERLTGIDFFCNLPDGIEDEREARCDLSAWGLRD